MKTAIIKISTKRGLTCICGKPATVLAQVDIGRLGEDGIAWLFCVDCWPKATDKATPAFCGCGQPILLPKAPCKIGAESIDGSKITCGKGDTRQWTTIERGACESCIESANAEYRNQLLQTEWKDLAGDLS